MICKFFKTILNMAIIIFASINALTVNIPNPPVSITPLNQPPRQSVNTVIKTSPAVKMPATAPEVANDVMVQEQPIDGNGNVDMGEPTPDTGMPAIDPLAGEPIDDPNNDFVPEPEKKNDEDSSTSVTKPSSSEYFVRIIPVTKVNLSSLAQSLGVKSTSINDSRTSTDWWASGNNSTSVNSTSTGSSSTGTSGSFGVNKQRDLQEDIKRLMTIYQAVDYDYQMLYTQAFNMTALKNSSITSAIRDLRVKHDKLASDIQDRWRLSDSKTINAMQDRVMAFQADIDDIREMDDTLKSPTAQQNQAPQYDANGKLINNATTGSTDLNSQLQQIQTAYQQAATQFANNPKYKTQLTKIKTNIDTAQNAILNSSGKKGNNKTATNALQSAATSLTALGIQTNLQTTPTTGANNPLLNPVNPLLGNGMYGNTLNPYGNNNMYGNTLNPYGNNNVYGNTANQYGYNGINNGAYGNNGMYTNGINNGYNTGYGNTGYNTGYGNTGYNTGYGNTGYNTGYGNTGYGNTGYGNTGYGNTGYGNTGYGNTGYGNTGYGNTGGDPRSQFAQLEAGYNALRSKSTGTITTAQKNELNSILSNVNTLRSQVNNQGYMNNQNNFNNVMNSLNNLQTKIDTYKSTYNISDPTTNGDGTTTTAPSELDTISTDVETINSDMQGIEDAIRSFRTSQFPKISNIISGLNISRTMINQIQLDLMSTKPNLSTIKARFNQTRDRINQLKTDVYEVQLQVLNYARTQLGTLRLLVNNSTDVIRNQFSGQVDTHSDELRNIETDFNSSSYIKDPSNQKDWAVRVIDLMDSVEATRTNVRTAINNK